MPVQMGGSVPFSTMEELWEAIRLKQLPEDHREAAIARIKTEGVPKEGTPQRGLYMSLFHRRPHDAGQDNMIRRLYEDTDVPVNDLLHALGIDANVLASVRRRFKMESRADRVRWHPHGRITENEELIIRDDEAYFRDLSEGTLRPVWEPDYVAEDEPIPEPVIREMAAESEPEPVATMRWTSRGTLTSRGRPKRLTAEDEAEIIRLYSDPNIPVHEIQTAYSMSPGLLYRVLNDHGVRPRSQWEGSMTDNGYQASAVHQLHLGQAPGAATDQPTPAQESPMPQRAAALAVPSLTIQEREWFITYTVSRTVAVAAPTIDEALRRIRDKQGTDIEVVLIQRS